jgi:hypothetical protein
MQLQAGTDAPQFQLADADMEEFNLDAQRGKKNIVLYFYPKDDTPGCTIEANEFSALDDDFTALDTIVVINTACLFCFWPIPSRLYAKNMAFCMTRKSTATRKYLYNVPPL